MVAMTDAQKQLEFLMSVVPAYAPVTIATELNVLERLGIVSNKNAVSAMRTASLLVPPDTPATFKGLVNLLTQLMSMNPKFNAHHKSVLDDARAEMAKMDDFPLTFGTFLPVCQKLMEAQAKRGARTSG
jgi:hypothetical protein